MISPCLDLIAPDTYRCRNKGIVFKARVHPVHCCGSAADPRAIPASAFLTTADLARDTLALIPALPPDLDAIVGIARSGVIPAGLLAAHLHLPLFSIAQSSREVLDLGHGGRLDAGRGKPLRRVLLVDDTVAHGRAMARCAPAVRSRFAPARLLRAAVYVHPENRRAVDLAGRLYPMPHFLEWNLWNAGHGEWMACDFDGILCEDIAPRDDDDGPRYAALLAGIRPKYLPRRRPVRLIVTGRLEKWRALTEEWLRRWGIRWQELLMHPGELGARTFDSIVRLKADAYAASRCATFVESDPGQARRIAELSGRPVVCPQAGRVFGFQQPARARRPRPSPPPRSRPADPQPRVVARCGQCENLRTSHYGASACLRDLGCWETGVREMQRRLDGLAPPCERWPQGARE
jgi:hypothetical protein